MPKKSTPEQKAKIRQFMATRRHEMRKPETRVFPRYTPGMTAGDYIRRYNALNCGQYQKRITLDFIPETLASESRTYDPLAPLCIEEEEKQST